jgi:hypothetical protein
MTPRHLSNCCARAASTRRIAFRAAYAALLKRYSFFEDLVRRRS